MKLNNRREFAWLNLLEYIHSEEMVKIDSYYSENSIICDTNLCTNNLIRMHV